jgi:hypothetical protein
MRSFFSLITIGFLAMIAHSPLYARDVTDDAKIVGRTIFQAMSLLSLRIEKSFVIDEPPAVPRGIFGRTPNGDEVILFIRRGQLPLTFKSGDKLELYKDIQVIGLKRTADATSTCYGEVLWQLACKAEQSNPADA